MQIKSRTAKRRLVMFLSKKTLPFIGWFFLLISPSLNASQIVKLATTTSTYHSGLLDYLLAEFQKDTQYEVVVHPTGTGKALKMGQNGDVDLIITHAPKAEADFIEKGFGILPRPLMYNDFILLGPKKDPAHVQTAANVSEALVKIAEHNAIFISRGDDSGTNKKENLLWQASSTNTDFSNYKSIGQGMGPALTMANELQGYTLSDRGTWLAYQNKLDLAVLYAKDSELTNPYQVILINPKRYPTINLTGAKKLSDWLVSTKGQDLINQFRINGQRLFVANYPNALEQTP